MFGRTLLRVLAIVLLAGVLVALGAGIYNAGLSAGAASVGASDAIVAPVQVVTYGWGFGGALFGFFGLLLVPFLIIGLLRFAFWGGRGHRHGYGWGSDAQGYWGRGGWGQGPTPDGSAGDRPRHPAEAMLEEWHRRAHGETASPGSASTADGTTARPGPTA
ncbi:MAG: hypothetical protein ACXWOW_10150 [Candidatus Limnocylindrales bacterium]